MKRTIFSKKPKRERISHSQKGYQNLKIKWEIWHVLYKSMYIVSVDL